MGPYRPNIFETKKTPHNEKAKKAEKVERMRPDFPFFGFVLGRRFKTFYF